MIDDNSFAIVTCRRFFLRAKSFVLNWVFENTWRGWCAGCFRRARYLDFFAIFRPGSRQQRSRFLRFVIFPVTCRFGLHFKKKNKTKSKSVRIIRKLSRSFRRSSLLVFLIFSTRFFKRQHASRTNCLVITTFPLFSVVTLRYRTVLLLLLLLRRVAVRTRRRRLKHLR